MYLFKFAVQIGIFSLRDENGKLIFVDLFLRVIVIVPDEACLLAVFRNRSLTHLFIFILGIQIKDKHALRVQIIVDEREDFPQIVFLQNIVDGIADAHNRLHGSVKLKFPHILKQI